MKILFRCVVSILLVATGIASAAPVHNITYSYKPVSPGTVVTIGGTSFVLVRLPMREFATDNRYVVEFLAPVLATQPSVSYSADLETSHTADAILNPVLISGFPAQMQVVDGRSYRLATNFISTNNELTVDATAGLSLQVKVGDTLVSIFEAFTTNQQSATATIPASPYSGSNIAQWSKFADPTTQVTALDDWIDYIRILKIN